MGPLFAAIEFIYAKKLIRAKMKKNSYRTCCVIKCVVLGYGVGFRDDRL